MKFTNSSIVAAVFIILLAFLANPFGWWMPTELEYLAIAALVVVATVYSGLIRGEKARDEREVELRAHAARAGYLAGIFMLTFATAYTILGGGHANPWILASLGMMIIVRFIVRVKSE